jgi:hypothetical protein
MATFALTETAVASVAAVVAVRGSRGSAHDAAMPVLFVTQNLTTVAGLAVPLFHLARLRPAGRTATTRLAGLAAPWAYVMCAYFAVGGLTNQGVAAARTPCLVGQVGAVCAMLTLTAATFCMNATGGSRRLEARALARTAPAGAGPPAPLRAAKARLLVSLVAATLGGIALLAVVPPSVLGIADLRAALLGFGAGLIVLLGVPSVVAVRGAARAAGGQVSGDRMARFASYLALIGYAVFVPLSQLPTALTLSADDARVADAVLGVAPIAMANLIVTAVLAAGMAFMVAGLTGITDPTSRRFLARARSYPTASLPVVR